MTSKSSNTAVNTATNSKVHSIFPIIFLKISYVDSPINTATAANSANSIPAATSAAFATSLSFCKRYCYKCN